MKRFRIEIVQRVDIEIDESVFARVDDEWRDDFYELFTEREIAEHVGYNMVAHGIGLPEMDGFADMPRKAARCTGRIDVEAIAAPMDDRAEGGGDG